MLKDGAPDRIRTCDPQIRNLVGSDIVISVGIVAMPKVVPVWP